MLKGEYPACSLILDENGNILVESYNQAIGNANPTDHGEILCIEKACLKKTH